MLAPHITNNNEIFSALKVFKHVSTPSSYFCLLWITGADIKSSKLESSIIIWWHLALFEQKNLKKNARCWTVKNRFIEPCYWHQQLKPSRNEQRNGQIVGINSSCVKTAATNKLHQFIKLQPLLADVMSAAATYLTHRSINSSNC